MPASDERRFQALILAPVRRVRRLNAVAWAEAGVRYEEFACPRESSSVSIS